MPVWVRAQSKCHHSQTKQLHEGCCWFFPLCTSPPSLLKCARKFMSAIIRQQKPPFGFYVKLVKFQSLVSKCLRVYDYPQWERCCESVSRGNQEANVQQRTATLWCLQGQKTEKKKKGKIPNANTDKQTTLLRQWKLQTTKNARRQLTTE